MKLRNIFIILIVIGLLLGAKFIFFPAEEPEADAPKKGPSMPANVTAFVVHPEKISNEVYASGTILANEEVQLQPEVSGKVVQISFREGSIVNKGELLVKINDAELQAQQKKLTLQETLANEKLQRQKQLLAISGISQEEFDVSQNQYDLIKADIDYTNAQIAKTEIRAPFTGLIGLKKVSEGASVNPATVIANIQQIDPVKVDFSVSERYFQEVKKGNVITFTVEGKDAKLKGEVLAVEPKIDLETRSLQIRAICPNSKGELLPGAFARVQLALNDIDSTIMIPSESIIPELKGQKVFCIRNGKAQPVKITTGLRTDTKVQVTSGLNDQDTVIVTGIMQLKPGAAVKVVEYKK